MPKHPHRKDVYIHEDARDAFADLAKVAAPGETVNGLINRAVVEFVARQRRKRARKKRDNTTPR